MTRTSPLTPATERPTLPKRVVITGGMPYGNKNLHFGHIGGMFVQADAFARFMRDRIGKENVLFVSGTDCYGSPIVESHRQMLESGAFQGSLEDFVKHFHQLQHSVLESYGISLDLFAASGFGRSSEIHREMCGDFFRQLQAKGHLLKMSSLQFFDPKVGAMLNGRQVVGRCPVPGCKSEKAYADECSLGHPYEPRDLIDPRSTLSGEKPELKTVENWYINTVKFHRELSEYAGSILQKPYCRPWVVSGIREFLEAPAIHVKADNETLLNEIIDTLPPHERREQAKNQPVKLVFSSLESRSVASEKLTQHGIRFREGKTLVPFRLTGDVAWGVPAPEAGGLKGATFWVWPESLWAPISFTATWEESRGNKKENWKDWWCSRDSQVFQFIGEDNLYFYSLAEMSLFMGLQEGEASTQPPEGQMQLPELVVNNHALFFDKKASSSGNLKPPMADELLNHYTADQIRAHFLALGLGLKSVGFKPKPWNPQASEKEGDPVLKEGNLLSNAFNKSLRTCFYTVQKYFDSRIPVGEVSQNILTEAEKAILDFEKAMFKHSFHECMAILDNYTRSINKHWTSNIKPGADQDAQDPVFKQTLIDTFHMIRTATVLFHPIAPFGTEMIREYLNVGEDFWDWNRIFDPVYTFMPDPATHTLKVLEPRVDFFPKHPSQY